MPRSFLVLQGTASSFFSQLGQALTRNGHAVLRVNFCGGDLLYGRTGVTVSYRGAMGDLPDWYRQIVQKQGVTDVLMFGDCREVHRHMHPIAQAFGLRTYVFEEGYIRPHWLTLEPHGVNGRSLLPRDPAWYLRQRSVVPRSMPGVPTGYNLYERAFHDISYRCANALFAVRFPNYRSHRPRNGLAEYTGLAAMALRQAGREREAKEVTNALLAGQKKYFLFPLQLNSDAQIVVHSPFDGIREALSHVLLSFASAAPEDAVLVVKNHPLDTGLIDYRRYAFHLANELGIQHRLLFIDSGHLPTLLEHARGVVVVNSTVGLSALHHKRPLAALGAAVYDMEGLTWQGSLDDFWKYSESPDMDLYHAFLDYVMHHTQINGDFYTRTGIAMAVAGSVERLEAAI
ncbi:capsule biosynthesis protein [Burkholderia cepacia]|uniref:capsule biosynthesis protein n=1 Tax=Burkholderia cepacia TaxID=292 RepID=UPI003EE1895F